MSENMEELLQKQFPNHKIEINKDNGIMVDGTYIQVSYSKMTDKKLSDNLIEEAQQYLFDDLVNQIRNYINK